MFTKNFYKSDARVFIYYLQGQCAGTVYLSEEKRTHDRAADNADFNI